MKYFSSFHTSLKISRYLFRVLGLMVWGLGAVVTAFYLINLFNEMKNDIRQNYNSDFDRLYAYFRQTSDIARDIQYMTVKHIDNMQKGEASFSKPEVGAFLGYQPLNAKSDCEYFRSHTGNFINAFKNLLLYWNENIAAPQGINQVFVVGTQSLCMVPLPIRNLATEPESLRRMVNEYTQHYFTLKNQGKERNIYWIAPGSNAGTSSLFILAPIYYDGKFLALIGVERTLTLEHFHKDISLPISITVLNQLNQPILSYPNDPTSSGHKISEQNVQLDAPYFGYDADYSNLLMKRRLLPSTFTVLYSMPMSIVFDNLKFLILNGILLNVFSAIIMIILMWMFERKIFVPAEMNAIQLEEHEQFNHKIVASAPVGICILRIRDGVTLLSNELAHNYWRKLSYKDRANISNITKEKTNSFIDVVTRSGSHLQISFVHSRYQNEEVAICVLVDISARVQLESSLQEMARASEQANQSKSMFLATVSHELRTPLYGIIGNLELLQSFPHTTEAERLLMTMNNSSSLLLKIISDILDFSKIESKQLKIEPREFNFREHIQFVISNYLPLLSKKRLSFYCFIEPDVPIFVSNDPVRMQQVISNLFNNAIKYTEVGYISIHVYIRSYYLYVDIQDTGAGISEEELQQLFDPFYQIMPNTDSPSQGTGLGLPICEKLISLMDGDIIVKSQKHVGSLFGIRIPLYETKSTVNVEIISKLAERLILYINNVELEAYLRRSWESKVDFILQGNEDISTAGAIVLSDHNIKLPSDALFYIHISSSYTDKPKQLAANAWLHNGYQLDDLRLFIKYKLDSTKEKVTEPLPLPALSAPANQLDVSILIVDDHPISRHLLQDQLTSIGFITFMAVDGLDALNFLKSNTVDMILTDVNMPNMDGYTLANCLREQKMTLPIIGITANAMAEEFERCINAGMDDCLSKPVTLSELRCTLNKYVPDQYAQS